MIKVTDLITPKPVPLEERIIGEIDCAIKLADEQKKSWETIYISHPEFNINTLDSIKKVLILYKENGWDTDVYEYGSEGRFQIELDARRDVMNNRPRRAVCNVG